MTTKSWQVEFGWNVSRIVVTARNYLEAAKKARKVFVEKAKREKRPTISFYRKQPITTIELLSETDA